jgi:endonuclease V-like protein UPF0215 family
MTLEGLMRSGRSPIAIGFDDAPFARTEGAQVPICGVVTHGTRFDGMLWGHTVRDGMDASERVAQMLLASKFHAQVHVVLLDGITMGGMNVHDVPALHAAVGVPCIPVMRKVPDRDRMRRVIGRLSQPEERWRRIGAAGDVHQRGSFVFKAHGVEPDVAGQVLEVLTCRGLVPECLRMAHLIGSAVQVGQSGKRA